MSVETKSAELQGLMVFMASVSHALETLLGRGAAPVTFRAGRTIGLKTAVSEKQSDLEKALPVLDRELRQLGIRWDFEPWKPASSESFTYQVEGRQAVKLVFRNCMIRCALFRYSHEQKNSLCLMNHGLFCGVLERIIGKRAELSILHAGENACLKELAVKED